MSLRIYYNKLAKQCTVGWKSHYWRAKANAWNQQTDSRPQLKMLCMFGVSKPRCVDRVEQRQVTAFAYTKTLPPSSPSLVEDDARPASRLVTRSTQERHSSFVGR